MNVFYKKYKDFFMVLDPLGDLPDDVTYRLPEEWLRKVWCHRDDLDKGMTWTWIFSLPEAWPTLQFHLDAAVEICRVCLLHTDKTEWPTLIGTHQVMDLVLGQEFKK